MPAGRADREARGVYHPQPPKAYPCAPRPPRRGSGGVSQSPSSLFTGEPNPVSELLLFNKPYQVLCQFTDAAERQTLANFIQRSGIYPAGRLDYDSEGLVLLTGDGALQARIAEPRFKLPKTYWVQVEGAPDQAAIAALTSGVMLRDGRTRPAKARLLPEPSLWLRSPPVRHRSDIPTHWLELIITEGRNRQVRRMTAAVGLPTLRLVRVGIGPWRLDGLAPGESRLEIVHLPAAVDPVSVAGQPPPRTSPRNHDNRRRRPARPGAQPPKNRRRRPCPDP